MTPVPQPRPLAAMVRDAIDELVDETIIALSKHDTETLREMAEERRRIRPGCDWIEQMISEYLSVWR